MASFALFSSFSPSHDSGGLHSFDVSNGLVLDGGDCLIGAGLVDVSLGLSLDVQDRAPLSSIVVGLSQAGDLGIHSGLGDVLSVLNLTSASGDLARPIQVGLSLGGTPRP